MLIIMKIVYGHTYSANYVWHCSELLHNTFCEFLLTSLCIHNSKINMF